MPKSKKEQQPPPSDDEDEDLADSEVEEDEEVEEEESEAEVSGNEEDDDDDEDEDGDDGDEEKKKKRAETRRRVKASRRGHRKIAELGGYSSKYVSSALDANAPIVPIGEVIKAAKWCPGLENKAMFEGLSEYEERVQISLESLPPTAAKVLQQNADLFLRRLTLGVVTRQADASLARASAAMVAAELRPLRKVLRYTFAHPQGVLRHAQYNATGQRLNTYDGDATKVEEEKAGLHKEQVKRKKEIVAKFNANKEKNKKAKTGDDNENDAPGPKKTISKSKKVATAK